MHLVVSLTQLCKQSQFGWDFLKLMSCANAFSFQKLASIPTPSLQTLFTETLNFLRKQKKIKEPNIQRKSFK